ncbi:MAG: tungsten ABC transporter substrate-binding protein [Nitrospirae bacterium]|nr:MAG: tungsten ABC transporter substrate-binding protein [Nitrospirota bacterium]
MSRGYVVLSIAILAMFFLFTDGLCEEKIIKMSTTTSTENSGLLDFLLPAFTKDTGIQVKVFAKGTGAAIRDGMDGNVDIVFVHDRAKEDKFMADGYGAYRLSVMHNDFVILGPKNDPAGIKGMSAAKALKKIAESKSAFISRGDDSGTHAKEQELWRFSGVTLDTKKTEVIKDGKTANLEYNYPAVLGDRFISIGQGMGKTLTYAEEKQAYTLADRGTYLEYQYGRERGLDLAILCEGDADLSNPYGIIPVSPKKYPDVKFEEADKFAKWLVSYKGQKIIADYKIKGHQAFFPDAKK